jgi:hemerythrin
MTILSWSNLFSVGVREIDAQHRVLIELLNRLAEAANRGGEAGLEAEALARLSEYIEQHFAMEERLMREHGYAEAPAHLEAHRRLTEQVQQMVSQHQKGQGPSLEDLALFLRQWLVSHILQTDRLLGAALNRAGVR